MRVAFSALTPSALRNFESVLRLLGERGHAIHLLIHRGTHAAGTDVLLESLQAEVPNLTYELTNDDLERGRLGFAANLRSSIDLLRFQDRRFHDTYRARARWRAPRPVRVLARTPLGRSRLIRSGLVWLLDRVDSLVPPDPGIRERLRALAPDVLLLSPYVGLRTVQPEYGRAAIALGIPTAVCVASWDNLSSKALIRPIPDRVLVWNEIQAREAVELHRVPRDRVVVTGAQCFDQWFEWVPRSREAFAARLAIDPAKPILTYMCFTPFVRSANTDEVAFVERWLTAVRAADDPLVAGATVLVRPHPKRAEPWQEVDLSRFGDVVVWPRAGMFPTAAESKSDYFDSIFHSAAVVGLNSTAMLEAGVVGRPVLTVLAQEFWDSQEGTLHFGYLLDRPGGLLRAARSLAEHTVQLSQAARGEDAPASAAAARFVQSFVRPHGAAVAATPVFADAVEELVVLGAETSSHRLPFARRRRQPSG